MKLTKSTDYALRILIHLAKSDNAHTMKDLAKHLHVPYNNLMKLVQRLSKAKILITRQGKGGGISLAVPAQLISLKDVIHAIDGPLELSNCLDGHAQCSLDNACQLKQVLATVQAKIDSLFESISIGDIAVSQVVLA